MDRRCGVLDAGDYPSRTALCDWEILGRRLRQATVIFWMGMVVASHFDERLGVVLRESGLFEGRGLQ